MLATMALSVSPGPDNIYVLMQSLVNGKKYGLATTAGLISGCLVHTSLLAFGVSLIIRESEALFMGIKVLGAIYLFYLAFKVFRSSGSLNLSEGVAPKKGLWQLFKQGFIMNVLNPKVTIFFLAFFPGFLFSEEISTMVQFYVLGLLFMFISFIIFSMIAFLSGSISVYFKENSAAGIYLKWLQIIVFVGIAVYILVSDN
ncbi:LysE family translocator [Zobellia sp. KMM 6746]|uniref:LysE family translocator n=2 Tax=Zobellia barbeyronii TaxID=2748009 RepID=A0ABS5WFF1_9FLAO|nr:LysE family translocator [Zobellia barbeyronii]MBT2162114.1 LysE family translocator [Zobellia barbeyronii]